MPELQITIIAEYTIKLIRSNMLRIKIGRNSIATWVFTNLK